MGSIISNIINYFYPLKDRVDRELDERPLRDSVDRELNEWLVSQYADNVYLMKIPQERINSKRSEIERRLSKGYAF